MFCLALTSIMSHQPRNLLDAVLCTVARDQQITLTSHCRTYELERYHAHLERRLNVIVRLYSRKINVGL